MVFDSTHKILSIVSSVHRVGEAFGFIIFNLIE